MKEPLEMPPRRRGDVLLVLFALLYPLAFTYVYFINLDGAPEAICQAVYAAGKVIQFGLPAVWVLLVRRERIGWPPPREADLKRGAWFGLGTSLAMALVTLYLLKTTHFFDEPALLIQQKIAQFGIKTPRQFVLLAAFYAIAHSLLEEYYWRWFALGRLRRLVSPAVAIIVSSLAFAAHHVLVLGTYFGWFSPLTWIMGLSVAIGGGYWAWLYQRSNALWGAWLSHFLVDAGLFAIGYELIAH